MLLCIIRGKETMQELSRAEEVARYLKKIPNLTTNKLVQYCWDNNLNSNEIQFVKKYCNNSIK